jgi:hypothetical protein
MERCDSGLLERYESNRLQFASLGPRILGTRMATSHGDGSAVARRAELDSGARSTLAWLHNPVVPPEADWGEKAFDAVGLSRGQASADTPVASGT